MATVSCVTKQVRLRSPGSYFLILQVEQDPFSVNQKMQSPIPAITPYKLQKYRTDVASVPNGQEDVKFNKNVFRFVNVNPFERIVLKIGCFKLPANQTNVMD